MIPHSPGRDRDEMGSNIPAPGAAQGGEEPRAGRAAGAARVRIHLIRIEKKTKFVERGRKREYFMGVRRVLGGLQTSWERWESMRKR